MRVFSPVRLVLAACALASTALQAGPRGSQVTNSVLTLSTVAALPGQTLAGLALGGDGNFYGVTESGGSFNQGTIFQLTPGGSLSILYSFTGGADGAAPAAALTPGPGGIFYGTASGGGNNAQDQAGAGTVYQITTNGVFTRLYSFSGAEDGDTPFAQLTTGPNGDLYGSTEYGGDGGYGTLFQITAGGAFTRLYSFDYTLSGSSFSFDNGASPGAALVLGSDGNFYGTTASGGANSLGTVFSLGPGGAFTTLQSFASSTGGGVAGLPGPQLAFGTNGLLYGTTVGGGAFGRGSVFQVTTTGALATLYSFTGGADGSQPSGGLLAAPDGYFYGATRHGGAFIAQDPAGLGYGAVFRMSPSGAMTNLYSFTGATDGGTPSSALILGSDGAFYGTTATTAFRIGPTTPPFILDQPATQTNTPGTTAIFEVTAGGSAPLGYQWLFDGTNLPGADEASLILTNAQFSQGGVYSVTVTNAAGSVTSSNATLVVAVTPPVILAQPTNQTVGLGANALFSVTATGSPPLGYQWRWNGTNIPSATAGALLLANVQVAQNGSYTVVVSNVAGSVTSSGAVLNVIGVPPSIQSQPTGQTLLSGNTASFRVAASGSLPLAYQWQFNSVNLPGQTGPLLTLTNIQWSQAGNYRVLVSNASGSIVSLVAPLTVQSGSTPFGAIPLYSFTNGLDGSYSRAALALGPDGALYGTASGGGSSNNAGTVFRISTNGAFTPLHAFTGGEDGRSPQAGLVLGGDAALYGVASAGGNPVVAGGLTNAAQGVIFRVTTNGLCTALYTFSGGADGGNPSAALIQGSDGSFYGMAANGGAYGSGVIFRLSNGVYSVLHSFSGNSDGGNPVAALLQGPDGNFYGSAPYGGGNGSGLVFKFTGHNALSVIHSFTFSGDGGEPMAALVPGLDGYLYGTTAYGGRNGAGVFFRCGTTPLLNAIYSFSGGADGGYPQAALTRAPDGNFYGVTPSGGAQGAGTVFHITTNGVLTTLSSFTGGADGGYPQGGLLQTPNGTLYGTTASGGTAGYGNIFVLGALSPPAIAIQPSDQTGLDGENLELGVKPAGIGPFAFQWQWNGMDLAGASLSTLTITNLSGASGGAYTVILRGPAGSVTSSVATVTIPSGTPLAVFPLHVFTNQSDGAFPVGALLSSADGALYGTTEAGGGTNNAGTIFKMAGNGTLTALYSFTGGTDGGGPLAGLVQGADGALYGTTSIGGGSNNAGTVFRLAINGTLTTIYSFQGSPDGSAPATALLPGSDGNLYGATTGGGSNGAGTLFRLGTNGLRSTLHVFSRASDGAEPDSPLVQDAAGNFYGTTASGGPGSAGTVFKITSAGILTTLHSFTGGLDGGIPTGQLVLMTDGRLYGTTEIGGYGGGTVFLINPDGSFSNIYSFVGGIDGSGPSGGLRPGLDGRLYGTTSSGGAFSSGTVFAVATNGTFETLAPLAGREDGSAPTSILPTSDGGLYGLASSQGRGWGAVFSLEPLPPPALTGPSSSHAAAVGDNLELSAGVAGPGPYSYQWRFNGTDIPGATGPSLSLTNLTAAAAGGYSVVVADAAGSVTGLVGSVAIQPAQPAWTIAALHSFQYTGDGGYPVAGLIQGMDGGLYGVTYYGGSSSYGTVFRITTNGVLTTLHSFNGTTEGGFPSSGLIQGKDGRLYGTTAQTFVLGGQSLPADGILFSLATNGGPLDILHTFTGAADGGDPGRLLFASDGNLYGATSYGGTNGAGTVFRASMDGSVTTIHSFTGGSDGSSPSSLAQGGDGQLYGTTAQGGSGSGTVFQLGTNGVLSTLYYFTGGDDGSQPAGDLVFGRDGALYGATTGGGASGNGTVFRTTTDGSLTTLYSFTGPDGSSPQAGLTLGSDGNLYGATVAGGAGGPSQSGSSGAAFRITPDGVLSVLYSFNQPANGQNPDAALVQGTDGAFYGTADGGGRNGYGTVFRLSNPAVSTNTSIVLLNPVLTGSIFHLSVPTQAGATYVLESKKALTDAVWTTNQTAVGTGGSMILSDSNAVSSTKFYRVSKP